MSSSNICTRISRIKVTRSMSAELELMHAFLDSHIRRFNSVQEHSLQRVETSFLQLEPSAPMSAGEGSADDVSKLGCS